MASPAASSRRRSVISALTLVAVVLGLAAGLRSSAAFQGGVATERLPTQIWAVVVRPDSVGRVQLRTLVRLHASGLNSVVAIDLSERQLRRLRRISSRANLVLLVPRRDVACPESAATPCIVDVRSVSAAVRLSRRTEVDLVVVRVKGPDRVRSVRASSGRILALAALDGEPFRPSAWRQAIERSARNPNLDLAVEPIGHGGELALDSFVDVFATTLPTDESYFPVAVWFESVIDRADLEKDKNAGLNTYIVLTADSNLGLVRSNGMKAFVQASERSQFSPQPSTETAGWELRDEIDMQMSPDEGYAELLRIKDSLPVDGRLRYNNFGKGVMFWETNAEARRYVNAVDLVSSDVYWFTDPHVCGSSEGGRLLANGTRALTPSECRRASNYGAQVERMRSLVSPAGSKPVWAFVEVGHPFADADGLSIAPEQVRAAVWHSLIAGARGIIYFNHSFGGSCPTQHVLRHPCYAGVRGTATAVNWQIRSLAPVLNAPAVTSGWRHGPDTEAMVKWYRDRMYVFAGSSENKGSTGVFRIPCLGDTTARVLGEDRSVTVEKGVFRDAFPDGNTIHIYRIKGGLDCRRHTGG